MGKAVTPQVPQRTGRDFGGRRGGGAATRILEIRRRKRFAAAGRLANFAVLFVLLFAALALVVIPQATGSRTYTVPTNSMAPTYSAGAFLVVKPAAMSQLKYGDIVTYQPSPDSPEVLTHRIVGFNAMHDGERTLVTKGDNATVNDGVPVHARQIKGKPLYAIPLVGYLTGALGGADRDLWMLLAVTGLVGQCVLLIVLGVRRRRRAG
ncbi:signal peptidase [Arthrobacter globiformis]|uniref:signal peptidase I n=1 Tax=Arthrobacter globiformis TaxID=1665 RepID=UPI00278071AB|nr:signal peptidase I [Arthrobacter globiformis]MDQ1059585.1 signal peptidase [Arthrobacter globiformis]